MGKPRWVLQVDAGYVISLLSLDPTANDQPNEVAGDPCSPTVDPVTGSATARKDSNLPASPTASLVSTTAFVGSSPSPSSSSQSSQWSPSSSSPCTSSPTTAAAAVSSTQLTRKGLPSDGPAEDATGSEVLPRVLLVPGEEQLHPMIYPFSDAPNEERGVPTPKPNTPSKTREGPPVRIDEFGNVLQILKNRAQEERRRCLVHTLLGPSPPSVSQIPPP